jgi:hypothetical protein
MKDAAGSLGQIKHAVQANKTQAVVIWAWVGAFCIAMASYWIIGWMLSADFATTYPSAKAELETSASTKTMIFVYEVGSALTALGFFLFWFLKPKIQTGKFSFLGLLCLASMTTYALNPTENYYSYGIAYSSFLHNWGSWSFFIPGFSYPNQNHFPESPFMWGASYVWFNIVFAVLFYWLWKWMDSRFPGMGLPGKVAVLLVTMFFTDVVVESLALRMTQTYGYIGAIQRWCFFGGHWYQFPVYIGVITAFFWFGVTSLIYFRDDRGYSWAERGADKLNISDGAKTLVRFLAITGAMWAITLGTYFIPVQWLYTHGDAFPADTPEHLLNSHVLCGEAVGYPCPGPKVPIPRRN